MKTIIRKYLVSHEENVRSFKDKRVKVAKALFSYYDANGIEYRKGFEAKPYTTVDEFMEIAPKTLTIKE